MTYLRQNKIAIVSNVQVNTLKFVKDIFSSNKDNAESICYIITEDEYIKSKKQDIFLPKDSINILYSKYSKSLRNKILLKVIQLISKSDSKSMSLYIKTLNKIKEQSGNNSTSFFNNGNTSLSTDPIFGNFDELVNRVMNKGYRYFTEVEHQYIETFGSITLKEQSIKKALLLLFYSKGSFEASAIDYDSEEEQTYQYMIKRLEYCINQGSQNIVLSGISTIFKYYNSDISILRNIILHSKVNVISNIITDKTGYLCDEMFLKIFDIEINYNERPVMVRNAYDSFLSTNITPKYIYDILKFENNIIKNENIQSSFTHSGNMIFKKILDEQTFNNMTNKNKIEILLEYVEMLDNENTTIADKTRFQIILNKLIDIYFLRSKKINNFENCTEEQRNIIIQNDLRNCNMLNLLKSIFVKSILKLDNFVFDNIDIRMKNIEIRNMIESGDFTYNENLIDYWSSAL